MVEMPEMVQYQGPSFREKHSPKFIYGKTRDLNHFEHFSHNSLHHRPLLDNSTPSPAPPAARDRQSNTKQLRKYL
jgi:hypothetical protein